MIHLRWAILLLWIGCHHPAENLAVPKDKLVPVLVDIHVARAAVQNASPGVRDSLYEDYFKRICAIHQLDMDSVRHDLDILTRDPDRMEGYYMEVVEVLDSLSVRGRHED